MNEPNREAMATPVTDRAHSELLALQHSLVTDIAFYKQQEWQAANYGLLLYAAILGAAKLAGPKLSTVEYAALWLLALTVMLVGLYIVQDLHRALTHRRSLLPLVWRHYDEVVVAPAYGGSAALAPPKEKSSLDHLFIFALVMGFVLSTWVLVSMWRNA